MKIKYLSVIVGLALMFTIGCEKADLFPNAEEQAQEQKQDTATMNDETASSLPAPTSEVSAGTVVIYSEGKELNLTVELAEDRESRAKGLSGRESLAPDSGMLFVFEENNRDAFWTKETYIPLDLIFISEDKKVVDIIANAEPNSEERLVPSADYRYVLEVTGGYVDANDIKIGDEVELRVGPR